MFGFIKWTFWITVWVFLAAFAHYTLPQRDIVRVVDTLERRVDFGENSIFWASGDVGNNENTDDRYIRFIQTIRNDGDPMGYRNEDTGWGWPPYFKIDSDNLQTEAADLVSTKVDPDWTMITHYGWRSELLSIYPNAISIEPVSGPDASKGLAWLNIFIITIFVTIAYAIWVRWRRFRMARIDPTLDAIEDDLAERGGAVKRWFGTWRSKG